MPGRKTMKWFFPQLKTLIKLEAWLGGTQFSERRKKIFGKGLMSARGSSDCRIAALMLGGFRAWELFHELKKYYGKISPLWKGTTGKTDYTETWLFAWEWMEQEWNIIVYSEYGLYSGNHKRSWQSYRQKIGQKEHGCWREVANCSLGTTKPQTYCISITFRFWATWLRSDKKANKQNTHCTGMMKLQKHKLQQLRPGDTNVSK